MAERDISERMIEAAVYGPDTVMEGISPRKIAEKHLGFRTVLRVHYIEQRAGYSILTANQRRT